jgi:hypothetical protein
MINKRDRRLTPQGTSLAMGMHQSARADCCFWAEALPPDGRELKADTASVKTDGTTSANQSVLNGEGTDARVIPTLDIPKEKNQKKKNRSRARVRNNYRVPVLNPDGTPAMPTTNRRANKWLKEKKAKVIKNDLGIFQIQLLFEPSSRNKQDIVAIVDPGSAFTGIGVISKRAVLYGSMLELPGYKRGSKPKIVINTKASKDTLGKKIKKYLNTIVSGMTKRRELRRSRRYRKTRQRECRFLNRCKSKIPPSIISRKQLEYRIVKELINIYPMTGIGYEDVKFNHFKDIDGIKGQFFSHVEVGKNWMLKRLKWLTIKHKMPLGLKIINGYETSIRRQMLYLKKEEDKTERCIESHVNDCIAMGSVMLDGTDLGLHYKSFYEIIETKNKFKFDVITRPKFDRRKLHLEQFEKGGFRRRQGGSTIPFSKLRKGDYVEARMNKKVYRGWVSGYIEDDRKRTDKGIISVSGFDWNRLGQFDVENVRLLGRNTGLLLRSMGKTMTRSESVQLNDMRSGIRQVSIDAAWQ